MKNLIVMPTFNERGTIAEVLAALEHVVPDVDVVVVDDSSPDGTADLVRADPRYGIGVFLLEREVKDGLGGAYRAGFAWALEHAYEGVVQMDADLSHPPERVPALLDALRDADVAVGSRYVAGGHVSHWTLRRRLLSRAGNLYVRLVLALSTRDVTSGFRAFHASALRRIHVSHSSSNGYCFQIENTWAAERLGLRVVEMPIMFTDRTAGESKMSTAIIREALTRVLVWRMHEIRARLRPSRAIGHAA